MRSAFITTHFDRLLSDQVMPMDIPFAESDDSEAFEEAKHYTNTSLSLDEERICDMATD